MFYKRKYISGVLGAPCTQELKKKARQEWETNNPHDYIVLGFTSDEKKRHDRFILTERQNVLPVLIDENISKQDCFKIIQEAGIKLPEIYSMGFPNANCVGCVKSSSPSYWSLVRKAFPSNFEKMAKASREIGCKLIKVKGNRIFLDELPDIEYKKPSKFNFECGLVS